MYYLFKTKCCGFIFSFANTCSICDVTVYSSLFIISFSLKHKRILKFSLCSSFFILFIPSLHFFCSSTILYYFFQEISESVIKFRIIYVYFTYFSFSPYIFSFLFFGKIFNFKDSETSFLAKS